MSVVINGRRLQVPASVQTVSAMARWLKVIGVTPAPVKAAGAR